MLPPPVASAAVQQNPDEIRQKYISHEASIRSIGLLYFLATCFSLLAGIASFFAGEAASIGVGVFLILMAVVYWWVGSKLRKLDPGARTPATILAAIGLLGFPIGTLINGYFLYLLQSAKGAYVFSEEYRGIVAATPHIKYRTSALVWLILALAILGLVGMIVAIALRTQS